MEIKDANVDVLCIAKINVDFSFPNAQFYRISFTLSHRCKQQKLWIISLSQLVYSYTATHLWKYGKF